MRAGYSLFTFCAIMRTRYLSQSDRIIFTFINNNVFRISFSPFFKEGYLSFWTGRNMKLIQHQISYKYYIKIRYWEKRYFLKGFPGIGTVLPGKYWNHHPWKCSKREWIWHFGTCFSREPGGTKLLVGLDLGGLFQPK